MLYYEHMTTKTLQAAMEKAAELPAATQDEIAREVFEHIENISRLRAALDVGLREADAGSSVPVDFDGLKRELHRRHGLEA